MTGRANWEVSFRGKFPHLKREGNKNGYVRGFYEDSKSNRGQTHKS